MGGGLTYGIDRWIILYLGLKFDVFTAVLFGALDVVLLTIVGFGWDYYGLTQKEAEISNRQNPLMVRLDRRLKTGSL